MRHRISGKQLGRNHHQRQALFRTQVHSFFTHGYIKTTQAKVTAIQPLVEKLCHTIHQSDLDSSRKFFKYFQDRNFSLAVVKSLRLAFGNQQSNFTKTVKIARRLGDQAVIVKLSIVKPYQLETAVKKVTTDKKETTK